MSYEIKSVRVEGETLWVSTMIDVGKTDLAPVEVAVFQPLTKQEVLDALELRVKSEKRKALALETNLVIKAELDQDIIKDKKV